MNDQPKKEYTLIRGVLIAYKSNQKLSEDMKIAIVNMMNNGQTGGMLPGGWWIVAKKEE